MDYIEQYRLWCQKVKDQELEAELVSMEGNISAIKDAFYRDLSFGTAGLRGELGVGINRMNIYTVGKASQGLADYLKKQYEKPSVAIAYDSRIKSDVFAKLAASVLAANGIQVHIWPQLMPVPALSYAVRALNADAGIVVTASHNPSKYNGYKVYGADGGQITSKAAEEILEEIEKLDIFQDVRQDDFEDALTAGTIRYISDDVYTEFVEAVKQQSVLFGDEIDKNIAIVYTPLNGAGLGPVTRTLQESGYTNITVVREQEMPNGNFPTCPYPNPEIREAMALGIEYAERLQADLLLATDPDCDRVGIAVRDATGEYVLLSGNQMGVLLLDYICSQRTKHGRMPEDPVFIKTIVSTDLCERIAAHYGVKTKNVLTGFKYIGEQIGQMEACGKADSYIFGFEESYGYLSGSYVRDKDAVNASLLICEMFCYYASQGISLLDRLHMIYDQYGYCLNRVHSYSFEGAAGFETMQKIMAEFRKLSDHLCGYVIEQKIDYAKGIDGLPQADVVKFMLEDDCSVIVRPSGTEPKIKVYVTIHTTSRRVAEQKEQKFSQNLNKYFSKLF